MPDTTEILPIPQIAFSIILNFLLFNKFTNTGIPPLSIIDLH